MNKQTKILALLLSVLMLVLAGCGSSGPSKEISLENVHNQIKEAYGDNYLPSMPYDSEILEMLYGINPEWVEESVAEGPMMSTHVDVFIGIKATEGNADNVEKALTDYRQNQVDNGLNYPMNMAKIEASQVYRIGDYVFFLILGAYYEGDNSDEEPAFYQDQMQIALNILKEYE